MTSRRVFGAAPFNVPGEFIGVDFSPDSRLLWAALEVDNASRAVAFDVESGRVVEQREAGTNVRSVLTLQGNDVLVGGWGFVRRISAKGKAVWTLKGGRSLHLMAVSPDRSTFVTVEEDEVHVRDAKSNTVRQTFKEKQGNIYAVAFSEDGAWMATGSAKGMVRLFDARTGQEQAQRKSNKVLALAFSPSGEHLLVGHGTGKVELWDARSLKKVPRFVGYHSFKAGGGAGCRWVGFSSDGTRAFSLGNEALLRSWRVPGGGAGPLIKVPARHMQGAVTVRSPDGRWLASGSTPGALSVWSTEDGAPRAGDAAPSPILGLALTPNAVIAAANKAYVSWPLDAGDRKEVEVRFPPSDVKSMGEGGLVRLDYDAIYVETSLGSSSREAFELSSDASGPLALSRDASRVAALAQEHVQVWRLKRPLLQASLLHDERVRACAFGPDDAWLATANDALHLWRLGKSPELIRDIPLADFKYVQGLAVSPRGWIAVSVAEWDDRDDSKSALLIVDPRDGRTVSRLARNDAVLGQVTFAGDGRAAVADSLGRLLLVDLVHPEKARWLEPDDEDAEPSAVVKDTRPVARRGDSVAYVGPDGSVVVETLAEVRGEDGAPFLLEVESGRTGVKGKHTVKRVSSALFEQRLAEAHFHFSGRFKEATPRFREASLKELGATLSPKADAKVTHLVLGTGAADSVASGLKAKGAAFSTISEPQFMELLLPTTAEAMAMLRNEVKEGEARWNAWRKRYMDAQGERFPVPLQGVDLSGADLSGYMLLVLDFTEAQLSKVNLSKVYLFDAIFRHADLREADFSGASCGRTVFTEANLRGASFHGAELGGTRFDGADLRDVDFTKARMHYVDLRGADLTGARMSSDMVDVKSDAKTRWPKGYKP
ncbi:pentapeptide repeat-containing protein [Myxococcus sp. 1LA]